MSLTAQKQGQPSWERNLMQMIAQYIHPFLESASTVIQQLCNVSITRGEITLKNLSLHHDHTWIRIGMTGELNGDVIFGLHNEVALKIVSAMMGGFPVSELDEIGKSAISELGNMISGNASTLLFHQGVTIDITPPVLIQNHDILLTETAKALSAPLDIYEMGQMEIQMIVNMG
jgi:chemotaxis protein CheX